MRTGTPTRAAERVHGGEGTLIVLAWVVGSGGFLGSNVRRGLAGARGVETWVPPGRPFPWDDPTRLAAALERAVEAFGARNATGASTEGWAVLWCAGAGVVGTSEAALAQETIAWEAFLGGLGANRSLAERRGLVFLASSAGGVYAGSAGTVFTEETPCAPISPYGRAKLAQERTLAEWAKARRVSWLVARISNLYGPGQDLSKPQGLISHISRCLIHGLPIHIYVPLDTIRDYLLAEDCTAKVKRALGQLADGPEGQGIVKILASERETTVAELISSFRRVAKRQLKLATALHPVQQQPLRLSFRSKIWCGEVEPPVTPLIEGIHRVHLHQVGLYLSGRLPRPLPSQLRTGA